ncbi:DUF5131 family protein [Nonomuraea sp. NPDC023979]|uniref:DUF5131 family protein n=1 Tax=Nonomuraea sp. NPDC023979 TaxID=3154796 RepID=UPI0033C9EFB5
MSSTMTALRAEHWNPLEYDDRRLLGASVTRWNRLRMVTVAELFQPAVDTGDIAAAWAAMAITPQHVYQVVTDHSDRMMRVLAAPEFEQEVSRILRAQGASPGPWRWPLANLWVGVNASDQEQAAERLPDLMGVRAHVRFLRADPLTGPIDLTAIRCRWCDGEGGASGYSHLHGYDMDAECGGCGGAGHALNGVDWIVAAGERGKNARPIHPDWLRKLRDDAEDMGVPFHFTGWGEWGPAPFVVRVCDPEVGWQGSEAELAEAKKRAEAEGATHVHTGNEYMHNGERKYHLHEIGHKPWSLERRHLAPPYEPIRRWGSRRSGRLLDGRVHDAMPEEFDV